uniref:Genome polyprotein n=1 Tax=Zucchini shoestring virus TaxID=1679239 RepID=A0A4Y5SS45_9POTV|nr:polyprotein [Zucchini shoestring virus]
MASVYGYRAATNFERSLEKKYGHGAVEQFRQQFPLNQNRRSWTAFSVCDGICFAYLYAHATELSAREFLSLPSGRRREVLVKARKALCGNFSYDPEMDAFQCECGEQSDSSVSACPECNLRWTYSEGNLMHNLYTLASQLECEIQDLPNYSIFDLEDGLRVEEEKNSTLGVVDASAVCQPPSGPVMEIIAVTPKPETKEVEWKPVKDEICEAPSKIEIISLPQDARVEVGVALMLQIGDIFFNTETKDYSVVQQDKVMKDEMFVTKPEKVTVPTGECNRGTGAPVARGPSSVPFVTVVTEFTTSEKRDCLARRRVREVTEQLPNIRKELLYQQKKQDAIFEQLEHSLNLSEVRKDKFLLRDKKGRLAWRKPNKRQMKAMKKSKHRKSFNGTDSIVRSMEIRDHVLKEAENITPSIKCATSKKLRTPTVFKKITGEATVNYLIREVGIICKAQNKNMELCVPRRKVRRISFREGKAYVRLWHMEGIRTQRDLDTSPQMEDFFEKWCKLTIKKFSIPNSKIQVGSSGLIVKKSHVLNDFSRSPGEYFIVRGRHLHKLYDARIKISKHAIHHIVHYSNVPERFWNGYNASFLKHRKTADHVCSSDLDVQTCGEVAALVTQILFPSNRITCNKCMDTNSARTISEVGEDVAQQMSRLRSVLISYGGSFSHVVNLLDQLNRILNSHNTNLDDFALINSTIGERSEAPWIHLRRVNEALIKGSLITSEESGEATKKLLEVVRWHNKRTESIVAGSVSSFRNKASGKAHFNPALMCDNQLDKNGNFLWGDRQYHAKRFFTGFYEKVDNRDGYSKHVIRVNPNGQRKLAIGNLIISTNFEKLRQQMQGEYVEQGPTTKECISLRNGNYVHVCSCVTLDDGQPVRSEIKMPTRSHLVLGNTGDPKYVDLPTMESDSLYIAKDGYCYMNIFLAMLVNVPEIEAKDFTKRVRDVVADKLGTWPSLRDVATAAYYLTIFHPDTSSAELPRILVDHKTKTMHVVDSFGSITTGYHVLKANTVNQLIQFAREPLDSEMKHYLVGGDFTSNFHITKLIKSIYKPEQLSSLLNDEPYIMTLALCSPTLTLTLFNSGSLERALKYWVKRDQDVAEMITLVESIARKVTIAKSLSEQFKAISVNSRPIRAQLERNIKPWVTYDRAVELMTIMENSEMTNECLQKQGFVTIEPQLKAAVEKTYVASLEEQWNELSLLEKWRARLSSFRSLKCTTRYLVPEKSSAFNAIYDFSPKLFVKDVKDVVARPWNAIKGKACSITSKARIGIQNSTLATVRYIFGDMIRFINVLIVLSLLTQIGRSAQSMILEHTQLKEERAKAKQDKEINQLEELYYSLAADLKDSPTSEEFVEHVKEKKPELVQSAKVLVGHTVVHQAKTKNEQQLEKILAFITLIMMMMDPDKSDCVYKILNKFKGVVGTIEQDVYHQSLDDISDLFEDKQLTIDFEVDVNAESGTDMFDVTFSKWWDNQLARNNTIGHYRIGGEFLEFTRSNASIVANSVAHGEHLEYLIRGAVGSGKSTNLPHLLSQKGHVLLIEPTRPLCENVSKQLRGSPFHQNPTIRMRGLTSFGSSPITVMTSGFALHYFAHNVDQLSDFSFIIFDECHVIDAQAMGFYCLLKEHKQQNKILKVSATPPGRETEFSTQFPVKLHTEDHLSFQQFVASLGTSSNSDVAAHADSILVYVASYNEVDQLSKLLTDKGYLVTKVDGRTMKVGRTEIPTKGTPSKKHFIIATNIIENGVTLDIEGVVDFGTKVVPELDVDGRLIRYSKKPISYGERIQRLGRVGRHKPGFALRIGYTEKGIVEIPEIAATEAAFLSFAYGLPVMTHSVNTGMLSKCTARQAKTMLHFELSIFYMIGLVAPDGTMHPKILELLRPYKLRDSEIQLNSQAIPHGVDRIWHSVREYNSMGCNFDIDDETRIPFVIKDVPEKLSEQIWQAVKTYKRDITFGKISSAQAGKIAYTLQTDIHSIPRTLATIDQLIASENAKHAHFKAITSKSSTSMSFSLLSIINSIQSRYMVDHSVENIRRLQQARAQIIQFQGTQGNDLNELIQSFGAMRTVFHQGENGVKHVCDTLGLKGIWKTSLMCKDILISGFVLAGGLMMIWQSFKEKWGAVTVFHQGFSARQRQKLKFRDARIAKIGREVYGDDGTIEHYFGEAYTKKGKSKGKTHGCGTKTRKFVATYGFKPEDYSYVRYVDPITGETIDENVNVDMNLVQEHFGNIREDYLAKDLVDRQKIMSDPSIRAYYVRNGSKTALQVDLTPHNPLKFCDRHVAIAGFPEREHELRQTGPAVEVPLNTVPSKNENVVLHEGKSLCNSMRDYNNISSVICALQNTSGGGTSLYGVGFNSFIITNRHLFRENNGSLEVQSCHGKFHVRNTTTLKVAPVGKTDLIIIRMPKDFPPFPSKLRFRAPDAGDKVCLIGANFQEKHLSSRVSESSHISDSFGGSFGRHWISTNDGDCGLPLVSVKDGFILGLHSLSSAKNIANYFAIIPADFEEAYIRKLENLSWSSHWRYNTNEICWGPLKIHDSKPEFPFQISKELNPLQVYEQSDTRWLYNQLHGNLKAVGHTKGNLVTKHVVKGQCVLFQRYLDLHEDAKAFFTPLMGHYMKSTLNKEAYIKDLFKYASDIVVGDVDCNIFENALEQVIELLNDHECPECEYITCAETIVGSLNMDAAVGALYAGKKKAYFEKLDEFDRERLVQASCQRLYEGKMGIWNGSLKAEIRPAEKVLANKTRTFTAAPIDTLLGAKVCVDDFNNWFYSKNMICPWTVGMTKFYKGWDEFMGRFPDGWVYCDADGSQFDSSLSPYLINAVLQIRLWAMEEWDIGAQMLRNLYGEITYTPIATPDGTIVKKFKGNNSGQPSTVVDNTLMVLLTMHYALNKAGYTTSEAQENCIYYINGDDLCIAVHPAHESMLDSFQTSFSELGLKYDFSNRHKRKEDLWFMSHKAMKVDGIYIPKLEMERIVAILEFDKSKLPEHRLEAITAAIIESWGYTELTGHIRRFYQWVLNQEPYDELARTGKAPFVSEVALRNLYTSQRGSVEELERYITAHFRNEDGETPELTVYHQADEPKDAGETGNQSKEKKEKEKEKNPSRKGDDAGGAAEKKATVAKKDKDVDVGTSGTHTVPRIKTFNDKMLLPKVRGKIVLNLEHLLEYSPSQIDLSNTRATQEQFARWYEGIKNEYSMSDAEMPILLNGLMVWCIENGTSPNINGSWVMMDGDEQVEYPLKPVVEHASPTLRQIMAHFSNAAEAYIAKRNAVERYMPRYGLKRNLTDISLARYAFDFYEITSKTPERAREAHMQMKAAAIRGANKRLFGIDGSVSEGGENTERHTVEDVTRDMHSLLGMRN